MIDAGNDAEHTKMQKRAQLATYHLIMDGLVEKKDCVFCGSTENLVLHHPDYCMPNFVIVCCRSCHMDEHSWFKETRQTGLCPKCQCKNIWGFGMYPRDGKPQRRFKCSQCGYVSWPETFKTDEEIIAGE